LYAGTDSETGELLREVGVDAQPVAGQLAAMFMKGKLLVGGHVETYPFRIPMSWKSRLALMRAGAKVRMAVMKYGKISKRRAGEDYKDQQQRVFNFMNNQTFTDFVGKLPVDADAIFRPTVSRSTGEPEQISAGSGVGYFNLIWDKKDGLSRNIIGGPSVLTETIAHSLGEKVQIGAGVDEVFHKEESVVVRYTKDGVQHEVEARYVICAAPAPATRKMAVDLPNDTARALDQIVYGPHVSASFLTNETEPQVWDHLYSIATPKKSFDVLIHNSNFNHSWNATRERGSSFMTFSPAGRGRNLIRKTDEEIIQIYLDDLEQMFPGFRDKVVEAHVARWPLGSAYVFPGRANIQKTLLKSAGRLFLAGDYLGTFYTETAVQTGFRAARQIDDLLSKNKSTETDETTGQLEANKGNGVWEWRNTPDDRPHMLG